jgi:uncharacterized protein with HEPN domain
MPKDPTIAIGDFLAEIAILHEIEASTNLQAFRTDPIVRCAAAYAIQTISEAVRRIPDAWLADFPTETWVKSKSSAIASVMNTFESTMPFFGRS